MWLSYILIGSVSALLGATPRWIGSKPEDRQRIYFANHTSHIDTVALWSALPPDLRAKTRTAAAADYWGSSALKRTIALQALNAVLIDRKRADPEADPLRPLYDVLEAGQSIIIFRREREGRSGFPLLSSRVFTIWRSAFPTSSLFRSISTTCIAACRRGLSFRCR